MSPDVTKLSRLRTELGSNTSVVRELVEAFATGVRELRDSSALSMAEQAETVHRLAGTAAMLVSDQTMLGLNHMEQGLRDADADAVAASRPAMCAHLDEVLVAFEAWVASAPPDGEPSPGELG